MIIKTEVEITPRRIADLMVTAIESGIGHWCKSVKLVPMPLGELLEMKQPWYDDERLYQDNSGVQIIVTEDGDGDGEEGDHHQIGLAAMEQAFILMQEFGDPKGYQWRTFLNDEQDALTADVWFQLAVFGEVVYS